MQQAFTFILRVTVFQFPLRFPIFHVLHLKWYGYGLNLKVLRLKFKALQVILKIYGDIIVLHQFELFLLDKLMKMNIEKIEGDVGSSGFLFANMIVVF